MTGRCSVEGCDRPHFGRGWCGPHYHRWRRYGDPLVVVRAPLMGTCVVDGCDRAVRSRHGWCKLHYARWKRHGGDPSVAKTGGVAVGTLLLDTVSYRGAHDRIKAAKGPASAHACVDCGVQAAEWAYDHADPDELVGASGGGRGRKAAYSTKPEHYRPLCRRCHRRADQRKERCPAGHPYSGTNLYVYPSGHWGCRECNRQANRRRKARRRAEAGLSPAPANAAKTCCPAGHEYAGENLYVTPTGGRVCWTCKRLAQRAYRARKRAAKLEGAS